MDHPARNVPRVQFEVQKIIGISVGSGNVRTYQVEWAPVWLSAHHLIGCEHLIDEFLQNQQEKDSVKCDKTAEFQGGKIDSRVNHDDLATTTFPTKNFYEEEPATNSYHVDHSMVGDTRLEMDSGCTPTAEYAERSSADSSMPLLPIKIEDLPTTYAQSENNRLTTNSTNIDKTHQVSLVGSDTYCESACEFEQSPSMAEVSCADMDINEFDNYSKNEKRERKSYDNGGDKHECDQCGKTFKFRCLLLRHIPVHIGQLRYQCNYCDKSYARKDSLIKHVPSHTKESLSQFVDREQSLANLDSSL